MELRPGDSSSLGAETSSLAECPGNPSPDGMSCHMTRIGGDGRMGSGGSNTGPHSRIDKQLPGFPDA